MTMKLSLKLLSVPLCLLAVSECQSMAEEAKVKEGQLKVKVVRAFPELRFRRPIEMTHANDGSNRLFVAEQEGVVRVFKNNQNARETSVFLDIEERTVYRDKKNEEGLLGLAFHPKYKENGEFFIYYTSTEAEGLSVISRFRVSKDDPNKADAEFEEEIMRIKQPFWNHNGGTIVFGPDGYLYIALGDGGSANDPLGNGQNLKTLLGAILRIDIDNKEDGKNYAIPKDNPFVKQKDARPEIYAYGLRNVWRMAFDTETGILWAGDVGQNLFEEIDIIVKGGNYGWNVREANHPFVLPGKTIPKQTPTPKGMIDPIWEYHHDIGKSITGGFVYRGAQVSELKGRYIYADYVTGIIWGLKYNDKKEQVTANDVIPSPKLPIMSFGSDEQGEAYFSTPLGLIYTFQSDK